MPRYGITDQLNGTPRCDFVTRIHHHYESYQLLIGRRSGVDDKLGGGRGPQLQYGGHYVTWYGVVAADWLLPQPTTNQLFYLQWRNCVDFTL